MVDRVLEGQRLQAALLAERRVQRPPHLWCALRLAVSGRPSSLVRHRLGGDGVGVRVVQRGRGMSNGGLGARPTEAGRGLVVRWRPCGAMQALGILQVNQRDAAAVGEQAVSLLLV